MAMGLPRLRTDERGLTTVETVIMLMLVAVLGILGWSRLGGTTRQKVSCATATLLGTGSCAPTEPVSTSLAGATALPNRATSAGTPPRRGVSVYANGQRMPVDAFHPETPFERPGTPTSQLLGGYADTALLYPVLHPVDFLTGLGRLGRVASDLQVSPFVGLVETYLLGRDMARGTLDGIQNFQKGWKEADYYEIGRGVGTATTVALGAVGAARGVASVASAVRMEGAATAIVREVATTAAVREVTAVEEGLAQVPSPRTAPGGAMIPIEEPAPGPSRPRIVPDETEGPNGTAISRNPSINGVLLDPPVYDGPGAYGDPLNRPLGHGMFSRGEMNPAGTLVFKRVMNATFDRHNQLAVTLSTSEREALARVTVGANEYLRTHGHPEIPESWIHADDPSVIVQRAAQGTSWRDFKAYTNTLPEEQAAALRNAADESMDALIADAKAKTGQAIDEAASNFTFDRETGRVVNWYDPTKPFESAVALRNANRRYWWTRQVLGIPDPPEPPLHRIGVAGPEGSTRSPGETSAPTPAIPSGSAE